MIFMKKLFLALAAISLLACGKESSKNEVIVEPEEIIYGATFYKGTVSVTFQGNPFDNEDIEVCITPSVDYKTASIEIFQIQFVPQMPVKIDITIPNVELTRTEDELLLACESVVPLAMNGEFPQYTVTNLTGKLTSTTLDFSLNFGSFPTSFSGTLLVK